MRNSEKFNKQALKMFKKCWFLACKFPIYPYFEHNKWYPVTTSFYFDDTSACYLKYTSGEEQKKGDIKFHEELQKIPTSRKIWGCLQNFFAKKNYSQVRGHLNTLVLLFVENPFLQNRLPKKKKIRCWKTCRQDIYSNSEKYWTLFGRYSCQQ